MEGYVFAIAILGMAAVIAGLAWHWAGKTFVPLDDDDDRRSRR
jgi:hypothetical protein